MDFHARNYDPAIARWTTIDPVTHFNMSTYTAFDNNPVYFADPSGTTTVSSITEAWNATPENGSSTWNSDGEGGFCDDCPQEGQSKPELQDRGRHHVESSTKSQYYHAGNVNGSKAGWYSEDVYFELFRTTIRDIGQGRASIESLHNYNFTDDVLIAMASWAMQAYETYGGQSPIGGQGNLTAMSFLDILPSKMGIKALQAIKLARTSKFAFWSGRGTQQAAINAGFKVIGQTRAGQNLAALTADMVYKPGSQAYNFWGRISQVLARSVPKRGTAHVFLTRANATNPTSIWNAFEKDILIKNKVKIIYNYID